MWVLSNWKDCPRFAFPHVLADQSISEKHVVKYPSLEKKQLQGLSRMKRFGTCRRSCFPWFSATISPDCTVVSTLVLHMFDSEAELLFSSYGIALIILEIQHFLISHLILDAIPSWWDPPLLPLHVLRSHKVLRWMRWRLFAPSKRSLAMGILGRVALGPFESAKSRGGIHQTKGT